MDDFTEEEKGQIRKLLKNEAAINQWIELQGAKKLVFHTYRQGILGLACFVGAILLLWDSGKSFLKGLVQ